MLISSSCNQEIPRQPSNFSECVKRECAITWALCKNNFPGFLAGYFGGLLPRVIVHSVSLMTGGIVLLRVMTICLLSAYTFDIANTTSSVEEDKLNKPHRPIPSGLLTLKQARARWLLSWCLAPLVALLFGIWPAFYVTLNQIWVFGFYVWPAYRHYLTKNIMVTGSTFIMLRLLNSVVLDIEQWAMDVQPDMIVCVLTMATVHLQDFRDVEGDYTTHAVTIPIMLSPAGQVKLRKMTALVLLSADAISILWIWMRAQHASAIITGLLFHLSSSILVFYTLTSCSRHQDRIMYRWWMATGFCMISHVLDLYLLMDMPSQ